MEQIINSSNYSKILEILEKTKNQSIANKRKVGALLVNLETQEILASGFNHNQYVKNDCENFEGDTFDTVIHAESDLILGLTHELSTLKYIEDLWTADKPISMFITFSPCIECSKLIVQYGKIKNIFIMEEHIKNFRNSIIKESLSALDFLLLNNINVYFYNKTLKQFFLQSVNTSKLSIYHSKDLDGFMSYYLMKNYISDKCFGYNYEEKSEWMYIIDNSINYFELYFGDVTPNIEWLENNLEKIKSGKIKISIFDHHINQLNKINDFIIKNNLNNNQISLKYTSISDSSYKYLSGCELVLKYILSQNYILPDKLKILSNLIGTWDSWRFNNSDYKYNSYTKDKEYFINLLSYLLYNYHSSKKFIDFVDNLENQTLSKELNKLSEIGKLFRNTDNQLLVDKIEKGLFKKMFFDDIDYVDDYQDIQYVVIVNDYYPKYDTYEIIKNYHKQKSNINENNNYLYITFKFNLKSNNIIFSIRSYIHNPDISHFKAIDIAKKFKNGGGHEDAAGFTTSIDDGLEFLKSYNSLTDI